MADLNLSVLLKVKDEATAAMGRFKGSLEEAEKASKLAAVGLAAAATAVGGFIYMAIKAAGELEQMNVAFTTMLGSAEKADVFLKDLINFAKSTPFELKGLQQAAKQLLAYGFAQEEVIPNLKALGNIASGVGMDKLPNLILAFGQVRAATRLTGMELRQFTEAGVPLLAQLSEQLKKTPAEIQEMVGAGAIGFPEVEKALKSLSGEGGRFYNLMENQSKTLMGMISNLKDAWNIFLTQEGKIFIDWAKQMVAILTDIVQNKLPAWAERVVQLTKWFKEHTTAIYIVAGAIAGALAPAVWAAVSAFAALAATLLPFIIGGALIGAIVAGIVMIVKHWDDISAKANEIWGSIAGFIIGIWEGISAKAGNIWNSIVTTISSMMDAINEKIESALNKIKEIWQFTWIFMQEFVKNALGFFVGIVVSALDMLIPQWDEHLANLYLAVADIFMKIYNKVAEMMDAVINFLADKMLFAAGIFMAFYRQVEEIFNLITNYLSNKMLEAWGIISAVLGKIKAFWLEVWTWIKDVFSSIWDAITGKITTEIDNIKSKFQPLIEIMERVQEMASRIMSTVSSTVSSMTSGLASGMSSVINRGRNIRIC